MSVNPNEENIKRNNAIERAKEGQPERGHLKKGEVDSLIIDLNGGIKEPELWSKYFGITIQPQQEMFNQPKEDEGPF